MTELSSLIAAAAATAARAPSVHNTQPWVPGAPVVEKGVGTLEVGVDPARTLPESDPSHRDLLISLGCWVEAFAIAAAEQGARTELVTVAGTAPEVTVVLRVRPGEDVKEEFTAADIEHRQVDRGRLEPDPAALQAALGDAEADWPSGVVVGLVPEDTWRRLAPIAETHLAASPTLLRETLSWLRLDPADPAYRLDGLSAEGLRIPRRTARLLARVLRTRVAGLLIDGAGRWHRGLRGVYRTGVRFRALFRRESRSPARLVLGVRPTPVSAGEWVALGRVLMRLWLTLDRYGLRVAVQSELKDTPETVGFLRRLVDGEPFAVFSVGRSVDERVPRSARRFSPAD